MSARTHVVGLRLLAAERVLIRRYARAASQSVTEFILTAVRDRIQRVAAIETGLAGVDAARPLQSTAQGE